VTGASEDRQEREGACTGGHRRRRPGAPPCPAPNPARTQPRRAPSTLTALSTVDPAHIKNNDNNDNNA
jgi:hypothetical protein